MPGQVAAMMHAHTMLERRRTQEGLLHTPVCQVSEREGGMLTLELSGPLPHDWCLRLASGLSATDIGLQNGYARRIESDLWICRFELQPATPPERLPDFLELALRGTLRRRRNEPPILDFQLSERADGQGTLELRVVARDAVGLLASVLHRVRAVGLAVEELVLATEGDAATHRISIQRREGTPAQPIDRRAMATSLSQLLRSG